MLVNVDPKGSGARTLSFKVPQAKKATEPLLRLVFSLKSLTCEEHRDLVKTPQASFILKAVKNK